MALAKGRRGESHGDGVSVAVVMNSREMPPQKQVSQERHSKRDLEGSAVRT